MVTTRTIFFLNTTVRFEVSYGLQLYRLSNITLDLFIQNGLTIASL